LDLPKDNSTNAAAEEEGTAAGEYLERLLTNQPIPLTARNGVYFDDDMKFYGDAIAQDIIERASTPINCEHEIVRKITEEAQKNGVDQFFLKDPIEFSKRLMLLRLNQYNKIQNTKYTFFDRGVHEIIAYLNFLNIDFENKFFEQTKEIVYFRKDNGTKDGISMRCKCCINEHRKQYNLKNKEKRSAHKKKHYEKNSESILKKAKIARETDHYKEYIKEYLEKFVYIDTIMI
jgi:hypothetical protein